MKKIGITTFHNAHNYGAMLQAFALCNILSKENDVEIINYYNSKIYDTYKIIRPFNKDLVASTKTLILDLIYIKNKRKRYKSFNDFINNKCKLSEKFFNVEDIEKNALFYDILVTGSDQVWSKEIVGELSDVYTLNFGNKDLRRISYAASVGSSQTIIDNKEEYFNKIRKLDCISVREEDVKEQLDKIMDKQIDVVLDPTLLLTKQDWNSEIDKIDNQNQKYIFAYVVKPDEEYIKIVNDLSEKTGLKVIHFGLKNPGYKNVLKSAYTEGPLEFVNYIKNAEYVVATSFHATVFSIIFNKKFFIVPHRKTGARVTNLLDKLGITGRTFSTLEEFKKIDYNFETDWKKVEEKLDIEREKSINWLKNPIEGEMN